MRKIVLLAIAFISLQATAQDHKRKTAPENRKERAQHFKNLTTEERATLMTKKMTLHLDLTEAQQAKIQKLNLGNAERREAFIKERKAKKEAAKGEKPTKEERVKMMNAKLDHQIEMKRKMRSILNDEQYEKWSQNMSRRQHKSKKSMHSKHKMKNEKE